MFVLKKKYIELEKKLNMANKSVAMKMDEVKILDNRRKDLEYKLEIVGLRNEEYENKEAYYFTRLAEFDNKEDAYFKANKKLIEENEKLKKENNNLKVDNNRLNTRNATLESINVKVNKANVDIVRRLWCNGESKRQLEILERRVRNGEYSNKEIADYINEIRFRIGV